MATTTLTPTSATMESPKVIKKAGVMSDLDKSPITPTQTSFGCQHIKSLLQAGRDKATEHYGRLVQVIRDNGNASGRIYKNGESGNATNGTTYLCLQCPNVHRMRARHNQKHIFSVESTNGFIFCHECKDFIYDPTFEEVRSKDNVKKRKHSAFQDSEERRLVSSNTTTAPCAATGLRGLYNMGQTCFMSVILQSIIHNPLMRAWYLSEGHKKEDCEKEACTSCAMDDIFTDFFGQEKHEGYGAVHMLQGCWKSGGELTGYQQQDAHEYLGFILNSLHTANTGGDDDDINGTTQHKIAKDCNCIVHQTFGGLLKSTVTCSSCKNTTTALDPFIDLSLDIKSTGLTIKKKKLALINGTSTTKEVTPMDLTECLDRFTSVETLSADAGNYHCRTCSSTREARKKLALERLPPVVPIHLKRFSHSQKLKESTKVETKIRFPLSLDLSPYTTSSSSKSKTASTAEDLPNGTATVNNNSDAKPKEEVKSSPDPIYELSSVVVHKGKMDSGHYVSYSRQGDEWFRFDDSMVVQVDEREALSAEAYMLFYVIQDFEGGER